MAEIYKTVVNRRVVASTDDPQKSVDYDDAIIAALMTMHSVIVTSHKTIKTGYGCDHITFIDVE